MTRTRNYGDEPDFSRWLRSNPELDSQQKGIYLSDIDYAVFLFRVGVLYFLEVKTRSAGVGRHQGEVLDILDQTCKRVDGGIFRTLRGNRKLRILGVFRLILEDVDPDTSEVMYFGTVGGRLYSISRDDLVAVLGGGDDPLPPDNWIAIQEVGRIQDGGQAA